MATDRETSYSPFLLSDKAPILCGDGRRADGRTADGLRQPVVHVGTVPQAKGSGYVELGGTKVLCGVYGPREGPPRAASSVEHGALRVDVRQAAFATAVRGKPQQPSAEERLLSGQLHQALAGAVLLETFPKNTVDVFVLILEAAGGELSAAAMAASVALADAGVEMRGFVSSCGVAGVGGVLYLDPLPHELAMAEQTATLTMLAGEDSATQYCSSGVWEGAEAVEAFELCVEGCGMLDEAVREAVRGAARGRVI